jgi:predicted KAP-like P-loop ATPase
MNCFKKISNWLKKEKNSNDTADDRIDLIRSDGADKLDRGKFACQLAKAIIEWKAEESFCIALYGNWGDGKTFIKKMMMNEIKRQYADKILITDFNPLRWATQNKISEALFEAIETTLEKEKTGKDVKKRKEASKNFKKLSATFGFASSGFGVIASSIKLIIIIIVIISASTPFYKPLWAAFTSYINLAIILLFSLEFFTGKVSRGIEDFAKVIEAYSLNIDEIKEKAGMALKNLGKSLLIIIDDIDRLNKDEIRALFQLIKINLDLPNIIFMILCQKNIVEKILELEAMDGADYLEKIVQISFDVPQASQRDIDKILNDNLRHIINSDPHLKNSFNEDKWNKIYFGTLSKFFKNLRKAYKYLNSLKFQLGLFKGKLAFEVNAVDFFVLEALRVFQNKTYKMIRESKGLLVNRNEHFAYFYFL